MVTFKGKILPYIIIYIFALVLIYLAILVFNSLNDRLFVAIILSVFVLIWVLIYHYLQHSVIPKLTGEGKAALRYTMLCKNCDWEWMSHTTEKTPQQCPNCREKSKLEIVGWRKVKVIPKKQTTDLRKYF